MGISCITRNTYSILSLLLIILMTIPSSSSYSPSDIVTKELINKLCSQPTILNQRFCIKWLTTDHRTKSINLHGLVEVAINKTQEFGLNNQREFARGSSNDTQLNSAYASCANSYSIANNELEKAKELLSESSFQLAYNAVYKAFDYAYACKVQFDGPSNEPQLVTDHVDQFIQMCHISRAFAEILYQS